MSDLISRQVAIDSIMAAGKIGKLTCCDILRRLPSAQPEIQLSGEGTTSDCISRQAAIEINQSYHGQMPNEVNHRIWKEINELPSAQLSCAKSQRESVQELVRCKECKYFEYDHPYIVYGVPVLGHLVCTKWGDGCRTDENGFCFMAERRQNG